jgi:hypothetical protein
MSEIINAKWSQTADLDSIFEEFSSDCRVAIDRKEPPWAAGHVRTVHFDPSEPISLDWIQKQFGGTKLNVRLYGPKSRENKNGYIGARTIEILGPPRNGFGVELVQGPDGECVPVNQLQLAIDRSKAKMGIREPAPITVPAPVPAPVAPAQDMSLVQTLITAQGKQNAIMLEMMSSRVQQLEALLFKQPAGGPALNPLDQVKQTAETITLLDGIRDTMGGSGSGGDSESIMPMIGEAFKMFAATRQQQPQTPSRGALRAPKQRRRVRARTKPRAYQRAGLTRPEEVPQPEAQTGPTLKSVDDSPHDTLSGIADKLSSLAPVDAAECVIQAIGNMPEKKRAEAMQAFMVGMSGEDDLDESSISDDTYSQDEDFPDPFSTEDNPSPLRGNGKNSDAPDDQAHRKSHQTGTGVSTDPKPRGVSGDTGRP